MRSDRDWRRLLLRAAVLAFFAVVFEWLNLLGIPEATHQLGATAFFRAVALLERDSDVNDEPVVLMFDERSLDVMKKTWPLTFKDQADFLNTLADYEPRAIFYDLTFYQARDGLPDFVKAIKDTTQATGATQTPCDRDGLAHVQGIPIFLAQTGGHTPLADLCDAGAQGVLVSWIGDPDTYPLQACSDGNRACPRIRRMDMAATRLWREWCADKNCADDYDPQKASPLFDIGWRVHDDPDQQEFRAAEKPCMSSWDQLALVFSPAKSASVVCPHALIVPAASIMICDDSTWGCRNKKILHDRIRDHIVIIGAQLPGLRDQLFSPVFGPVPGVYVHAAAFANLVDRHGSLLIRDEDYFSEARESFFSQPILWSFILLFGALAAVQLYLEWVNGLSVPIAETSELEITPFKWFFHRRVVRYHERMDWLRVAAHAQGPPHSSVIRNSLATIGLLGGAVAIAFVIALGFSWFMYSVFSQSPVRWVGEAMLVITLSIPEVAATAICAVVQPLLFFQSGRRLLRVFLDPPKKEDSHEDIVEDDIVEIVAPG